MLSRTHAQTPREGERVVVSRKIVDSQLQEYGSIIIHQRDRSRFTFSQIKVLAGERIMPLVSQTPPPSSKKDGNLAFTGACCAPMRTHLQHLILAFFSLCVHTTVSSCAPRAHERERERHLNVYSIAIQCFVSIHACTCPFTATLFPHTCLLYTSDAADEN